MATLSEYLKNLEKEYKPQPSPVDEDDEQKAAAFDYLTGRSGGDE